MISEGEGENFNCFVECLSVVVVRKFGRREGGGRKGKGSKGRKKETVKEKGRAPVVDDEAELGEFVQYLAEEIFLSLPAELRTLCYAAVQDDAELEARYAGECLILLDRVLPPSVADSLCSYGFITDRSDAERFLEPAVEAYISASTTPPPAHTPSSRAEECEICGRPHLPLTYHHLIPREVHAKAVKRGWCREWELAKVAWLCRACHSFVHGIASNEELARELGSVELLLERDDVRRFAAWVSRVRWKAR